MLIPFIDQDRLLAAAASVPQQRLTEEERARNRLGDILVFSHAPGGCWGAGQRAGAPERLRCWLAGSLPGYCPRALRALHRCP